MGLSLKPAHLRRYKDIVRLLLKYGRSDIFRGAEAEFGDETPLPSPGAAAKAEELAADFEAMGPTFIKLGQLLS